VSWVRLTVELSPGAQRDLRALDGTIRPRVVKAVARYAETGTGDVKQLQGSADYRLRVGNYRVRFAVVGGQVSSVGRCSSCSSSGSAIGARCIARESRSWPSRPATIRSGHEECYPHAVGQRADHDSSSAWPTRTAETPRSSRWPHRPFGDKLRKWPCQPRASVRRSAPASGSPPTTPTRLPSSRAHVKRLRESWPP